VPWLTPKDLSERPARFTAFGSRNLSQRGLDSCSATLLPEGAVLLTSRAPVGYVSVAATPIATNQGFKSLVLDQTQDSLFWYYLLGHSTEYLLANANGSTFQELSGAGLRNLNFRLPPLNEQRKIAGVLGALDDLIEVNRELMADLDELSMALFRAAWDGDTWVQVDEIGDVEMGSSPPGHTYNEEGLGVVFYQGVRDFGDKYPSARVYCTEPKRLAEKGDILIAVRAPIGNTNIATERTAIGRGLARLRSRTPSTSLRALRADPRTWAPFEGSGTVFASISGPDLKSARVPSVADSRLEEKLAILDRMHEALHAEISELIGARDELLPLLMSGRLRVGDDAA
jgi:type I restriction enzyme S subunit